MTKRDYKIIATRLYKEDIEEYNRLYDSVRYLIKANLLDDDWLDFIWKVDNLLYINFIAG